jgi:hypothetical protein
MIRKRIALALLAAPLAGACSNGQPMVPELDPAVQPAAVAAAVTETPFTATDVPVAAIDPGKTVVTPSRIVIHGLTVGMYVESTDPRLTGFGEVVANGVLDPVTGAGPVWGTFFIDAVDGRWVGNWHGKRAPVGDVWIADIEWTGRGLNGSVEGLHVKANETITSASLVPSAYLGEVEGFVRSH